MRRMKFAMLLMGLALASCSQQEERSPRAQVADLEVATDAATGAAPVAQFGFMEAMEQGPTLSVSGAERAHTAASMVQASTRPDQTDATPGTQIAYAYAWGFQVAPDDLPTLQQRHRALCEAMGVDCRVLSLSQSGNDDYGYGRMQLQVAAGMIDAFSEQLNAAGDDLDAEQISFAISGEDLTDDIIDSEARLQARTVLRDRLMDVLRNRQGSVADLVAAERGVAEVNEEIDATQSRLANLRNRVAYTAVSIEYDPEMGYYTVGFWAPVANALSSVTSTLGVATAAVIYLIVGLLPFLLLFFALRWLWRKSGFRLFGRKSKSTDPETA